MRPCLERHNSDLIQTGSARLDHFSAYWLGEARSGAGNGSLFAWSSMLTAVDYYSALFPKYHPARIFSGVYISFCFMTSAILTYNEAKLNTRKRIIFGYTLFFINALLIVVIDLATSGRGGIVVFLAICIITAACGVADAFVQGGMVGDLSFMDSNLMQSFLAGVAMSGTFTSALRLITKASFGGSLRKGALMFFTTASVFEFFCVLLYAYVFPKLPIVKFYRLKAAAEGSKTVYADLAAAQSQVMSKLEAKESTTDNEDPQQSSRLTTGQLLIKNLDYCLDLYLIYTITFSIVPGFLSEDTGNHSLGSWYALVLLSMYNVTDLIGRCSPLINCVKIESRKVLMLACISRSSSFRHSTWQQSTENKGPEANALGNLLIVFLQGGLLSGVSFDWLWLLA
ncbi:hypothetical protein HPP92_012368 [Vanilla planifolia]|uniref:Equilibrative nucleoside transporter n=1 Tax=Vanilla planifolia TaxID=51239 RepID=A0A835V2P0_VANPL|nr:hypothetical protein HPP92_012368 [Vanilla planifolia]